MTNPRQAFILIGLLAQAMTWDSPAVMLGVMLLWIMGVTLLPGRIRLRVTTEGFVLMAGCLASIVINRMLGRTAHFFLGDGLILLQIVRLARPLTQREKLTSLVIACFHFGVVCTLAPNIRFVLLFVASLFLFPKALKEVLLSDEEVESLPPAGEPFLKERGQYELPRRVYAGLLAISVMAFIGAPRFSGSPLQLRDSMSNHGSLLDSILDPRRGGQSSSSEVLMQIEGDYVGYLRCFVLSVIDGDRWHVSRSRARPFEPERNPKTLRQAAHRKVFIKNPQYLGRTLPVDGQVINVEGNFFRRVEVTEQGALEAEKVWAAMNSAYDYWVRVKDVPEALAPAMKQELLKHPPQSERLKAWVAERTARGRTPLEKARLLEGYLSSSFKYELGTPELSRMAPVDDFVFNRQEGHCERFAAALGLMLRMEGIPSRVVIGYMATERNIFSGRLQVRFRDAHAWTEAWFEKEGWVTLDATPGGASAGVASNLANLFEALDFAWYSHVVNFTGLKQAELAGKALRLTTKMTEEAGARIAWGLLGAFVLFCLFHYRRRLTQIQWWPRRMAPAVFAHHSYGRMLALLHRAGLPKPPQETPLEFLEKLRQQEIPGLDQAALVTHAFCRTAYANQDLPAAAQTQVERALRTLREEIGSRSLAPAAREE